MIVFYLICFKCNESSISCAYIFVATSFPVASLVVHSGDEAVCLEYLRQYKSFFFENESQLNCIIKQWDSKTMYDLIHMIMTPS